MTRDVPGEGSDLGFGVMGSSVWGLAVSVPGRHTVIKTPRYATYVGRVGALAVALGVGAAVVTGQGLGLGLAHADTSAPSADGPAGDPPTGPPAPDGAASAADDEGDPDSGVGSRGFGLRHLLGQPLGSVFRQQRGRPVVESAPVEDAGPRVTSPAPEVAVVVSGVGGHRNSGYVPRRLVDAQPAGGVDVMQVGSAAVESGQVQSRRRPLSVPDVEAVAAEGSRVIAAGQEAGAATFAQVSLRVQPQASSTPQPLASSGPAFNVAAVVVGLLSPFSAPGPVAPVQPPVLWAVLAWVRREVGRTFFNKTPHAVVDSVTTVEDTAKAIDVLHNDTDDPGDVLTVTSVTQPVNGSVAINPDGTVLYTPKANWSGTESFSYTVSDAASPAHLHGLLSVFTGQKHTATGTVTVTVTGVNDAPVADNDSYSTDEDTALTVPVGTGLLNGDTDGDGDVLTAAVVSQPTNGMVTLNANGSFTYTPNPNANGPDSFTYKASDGTLTSNLATVSITVNPVDDAPVAVDDTATVAENGSTTITVLANDTDPDGKATINAGSVVVTQPGHGTASVDPVTGVVTYKSNGDGVRSDSFTYTVKDSSGAISNAATVSVKVTAVNDAPVANPDSYTIDEDTRLSVPGPAGQTPLFNDTDAESDPLIAVVVTQPTKGTLILNGNGTFLYTPNLNANGTDSFTYKVNDGTVDGNTATVTITITPVNDGPPAAGNDAVTVDEGGTATISVLGNDTDPDGAADIDRATVAIVTGPAHGSAKVNADGTITYASNGDEVLSDSFTYTVKDSFGAVSNTATANIAISAVDDLPTAPDFAFAVRAGQTVTQTFPGVDPDGPSTLWRVQEQPTLGNVVLRKGDNTFTYRANNNASGTEQFTYSVYNGDGVGPLNTATGTVTVTIIPASDHDPIANGDNVIIAQGGSATVNVLANDTDPDGNAEINPASVAVGTGPTNGSATVNADGTITYVANGPGVTSDSFTYTVKDSFGAVSNAATVNLATNVAPLARNDAYVTNEDTALTTGTKVLANDTDANGTPLTAVLVANPAHGTVNLSSDGSFVYTPEADYNGSDSFTYKASDGVNTSNTVTASIIVQEVNDNIRAGDDAFITAEDQPITLTAAQLLANDVDPDEFDTETFNGAFGTGVNGTWSQTGNSVTFTPTANYYGPASFQYSVKSTDGSVANATVTIMVTPVNDAPTTTADNINPKPNTIYRGSLMTDASDVEGDPLTFALVSYDRSYGTLTVNPDGTYVWDRNATAGMTSFTWSVTDGKSAPVERIVSALAF